MQKAAWVGDTDQVEFPLSVSTEPEQWLESFTFVHVPIQFWSLLILMIANIFELLLWAKLFSKCFSCILAFNFHSNPMTDSFIVSNL